MDKIEISLQNTILTWGSMNGDIGKIRTYFTTTDLE